MTAIFGFIFGCFILLGSMFMITDDRTIFVDFSGCAIVLGGTFSAALIAFSKQELKQLLTSVKIVFKDNETPLSDHVTQIVTFCKETGASRDDLREAVSKIRDPFFREGAALLSERVSPQQLQSILSNRIRVMKSHYGANVDKMKTLGKFPPAFGMIGTVIGLVALLQGLGSEIGQQNIGPAMAVGLITTLYGLLISNFLIIPIAEKLGVKSENDNKRRQVSLMAILLIQKGEGAVKVQEYLNSMLLPSQRIDVMGVEEGFKKSA